MISEKSRPTLRMRMRTGKIEIEIECQEDQLGILERILSTFPLEQRRSVVSVKTCKDLIQKLWLEGWFSSFRTLGEIHREVSHKGFHYNRGTVAHVLADLVKENLLAREGQSHKYRYIQKKHLSPTARTSSCKAKRGEKSNRE